MPKSQSWTPLIVAKLQTPCWPWHLRQGGENHPVGGECAICKTEIAVPSDLTGFEPICLYCALDNGVLPLVEIDPDDARTLHQMAMDERA